MTFRLSKLLRDSSGTMVIETAIVAPVLVLMALGTFDVSQMVSKQSDLQSAAAEAEAIVQASPPTDDAARTKVSQILDATIDPTNTNPNETVTVDPVYRCSTGDYQTVLPTCATGQKLSTFIKVVLTNKYVPTWTSFGVGHTISYNVTRMVQIS